MKEEELLVGIDFSLNSPSITIKYVFENEEHYQFCSFFNTDGREWLMKDIKAFKNHKALNNNTDVYMMPYERKITASDYTEKESQKIADAQQLSQLIVNYIKSFINETNLKLTNIKVAIEGFSYGSKGAAYNDLIMYNSFFEKRTIDVNFSRQYICIFS